MQAFHSGVSCGRTAAEPLCSMTNSSWLGGSVGVILEASPFLRTWCGLVAIIRQNPVFSIDARITEGLPLSWYFWNVPLYFPWFSSLISNLGRRKEASSSSPYKLLVNQGSIFILLIGILLSNCRVKAVKFVSCLLPVRLAFFKLQGRQHIHKPQN